MPINNLYSTTKQGTNNVIPKNTAESTSYQNTVGSEPSLKEKVDTLYSYFETFGSAKSAIKLYTPRKIGNASFDGTKDITLKDIGIVAVLDELGYTPINKAGDTMEGNLIMKNVTLNDGVSDRTIITAYDDGGSNYGSELTIQSGGNTFIGSGESASGLRNKFQTGDLLTGEAYRQNAEETYLTSDGGIYFYSGIQTIDNRKGIIFDNNGILRPLTTNTMQLGSTNYHWASAYIDSITSNGSLTTSLNTATFLRGNQGYAFINSTAAAGAYIALDKLNSTNGYFTDAVYGAKRLLQYTAKSTVDSGTNAVTKSATLLDESGNTAFPGTVTASKFNGTHIGPSIRRYVYGADSSATDNYGYYKICSVNCTSASKTSQIKLRIWSDNWNNFAQDPAEVTIIYRTNPNTQTTTNVYVYIDNELDGNGLMNSIYIKYPTSTYCGLCEIYFLKDNIYEKIIVDVIYEGQRGLSSNVHANTWTFYGNNIITNTDTGIAESGFTIRTLNSLKHKHGVSASNATFNGIVTLTRTTSLSGTTDNGPALIIGGTRTTAHMEIDTNKIQAKSNGTTTSNLQMNPDGGDILIGANTRSNVQINGHIYPSEGAASHCCGTGDRPWSTVFSNNIELCESTGSHYGELAISRLGTANTSSTAGTIGINSLSLGNNIAVNSAIVSDDNPASGDNNAMGIIYLYGTNTGYTLLTPTNNTTSNITLNLPSGGGTLARTTGDAVQYIKGTLTNPTTAGTYYIPFHSGATTGNKALLNNNGFGIYSLEGTTSALGYDILFTGNNIASGTAGNKYGGVRLYGQGTYFTQIVSGTPTANRTITLPDKSGTIALTSDALDMATKDGNGNIITDTYLPLSGGTMTGALNMNSQQITNVNTIYASNWFRSSGATGWYNTTYGGQIYQNDATWIKSNKAFYAEGTIRAASDIEAKIQVRLAGNSKGVLLRNDDTYFWILICDRPYSGYNNLRPLSINLSNGDITLSNIYCPSLHVMGETWKRTNAGYHRYIYTSAEGDGHNIVKLVAYSEYMECHWYTVNTYGVTWWLSDKRLKTNIEDTNINALDLINKIECKSFDWKDETKSPVRCGLISQQLEDIGLDDCIFKVKQSKDSQTYKDGIEEIYQIDDGKIIPYLIKSIQELSQQNKELLDRISILENKLNDA